MTKMGTNRSDFGGGGSGPPSFCCGVEFLNDMQDLWCRFTDECLKREAC